MTERKNDNKECGVGKAKVRIVKMNSDSDPLLYEIEFIVTGMVHHLGYC